MNKTFYVSFPLSEYQAICDTIRDILGITETITSDQIPEYVRQIAALGTRSVLVDSNGTGINTTNGSVLVREEVFE